MIYINFRNQLKFEIFTLKISEYHRFLFTHTHTHHTISNRSFKLNIEYIVKHIIENISVFIIL